MSQDDPLSELGSYIRAQRQLAHLSLRHLAGMIDVSDSYLSQIERGLHRPSGEILKAISAGLGLEPDALFRRMGWISDDDEPRRASVADAIEQDDGLTSAQKAALVQMYKTMVDGR